MEKIGIMTFHRALNYGAVLQAYALQQVLRSLGKDAQIIDYRCKRIEKLYAPFSAGTYTGVMPKMKKVAAVESNAPKAEEI